MAPAQDKKPSSPCFLAVDLGGKSGWAISWSDGEITSGVEKFTKASTKKHTETPGLRFVRFGNFLDKLTGVSAVFYEEVHAHAGTDAAHAYGGYRAILFDRAERNKIQYSSFGVGTIKKRATGKGNAKKPEMIKAANEVLGKKLGKIITDDNEADALWILVLGLEKMGLSLGRKLCRKKKSSN